MSIGIELLIIAMVFMIFSNGGIYSLIYGVLSVAISCLYFLLFMKEYKRLENQEKVKYRSQIDGKLIIILMMIITINLIYPLGDLNLIFASIILLYFTIITFVRIVKKNILIKKRLINYNYMFDLYCAMSLFALFMEVMNYAI